MTNCSTCRFMSRFRGSYMCIRISDNEEDSKNDPIHIQGYEYCPSRIIIMKPEEFGCLLHEPKDSKDA